MPAGADNVKEALADAEELLRSRLLPVLWIDFIRHSMAIFRSNVVIMGFPSVR